MHPFPRAPASNLPKSGGNRPHAVYAALPPQLGAHPTGAQAPCTCPGMQLAGRLPMSISALRCSFLLPGQRNAHLDVAGMEDGSLSFSGASAIVILLYFQRRFVKCVPSVSA